MLERFSENSRTQIGENISRAKDNYLYHGQTQETEWEEKINNLGDDSMISHEDRLDIAGSIKMVEASLFSGEAFVLLGRNFN